MLKPHKNKFFLLKSSLAMRFVGLLIWATVLAGFSIIAFNFYQYKDLSNSKKEGLLFSKALLLALEKSEDERDAKLVLTAMLTTLNTMLQNTGQDVGPRTDRSFVQLYNKQSQLIYSGGGTSAIAESFKLQTDAQEIVLRNGKRFLVTQVNDARWSILLAELIFDDLVFLEVNINGLLPFLLIGILAAAVPFWLATVHGLKPLRLLSDHLQNRHKADLAPIEVRTHYTELEPIVKSLNHLLENTRHHLRRESEFIQNAAHELRTPMAVITSLAHVIEKTPNPIERQLACADLRAAIQRASHLTQQLLTIASINEGTRINKQHVDVAEFIRRMMIEFNTMSNERGIQLSLKSTDKLMIDIDINKLLSIVQNLLDNAIRYNERGTQVKVTLALLADTANEAAVKNKPGADANPRLHLIVADNGCGIPDSERDRIFDRFVRGKSQTERGTGLGLSIALQAVETMGGNLRLTSDANERGSVFTIVLPI
jgi:two-component system, OmpR family, sensor histidine kinase QseC